MDRVKRNRAISATVALLLSAAVAMPVLAADPAEGEETAPPAGQRVEVSDLGIAVTWPDGWRTETEPPGRIKEAEDFTPVDLLGPGDRAWGGFAYARPTAKGSNFECDLQLYESTDLTLAEIADWFTQLESPGGGVEYEPAEVDWRGDLPAGEAMAITLRVDWYGTPTIGVRYWIDGGDAIAMLGCGGGKPAEAISAAVETIAPTIEFLPGDGEPVLSTYVTGKVIDSSDSSADHPVHTTERLVEWSDPRLPSRMVSHLHVGLIPGGHDTPVTAGTVRLEGPDGVWMGTTRSFLAPGGQRHEVIALEGDDAYEGLSAMLGWKPVKKGKKPRLEGFILESDLPGYPDPVPPFDE